MATANVGPQYAGRHGSQQVDARVAKNLDLGLSGAYYLSDGRNTALMPPRPKSGNPTGRDVNVKLNSFNVLSFPTKPVYQYDISIGSGSEKRQLLKRIWESNVVSGKLGRHWIWDGNKIAWSMHKVPNDTFTVDLDKAYNKQPRMRNGVSAPDEHRFAIRFSKVVDFETLRAWLSGTAQDDVPLHTITFLDCLMRQTPSEQLTPIKRQFFLKGQARAAQRPFDLGNGLEAYKGVYSSLRPSRSAAPNSTNLAVNVDVANGTFWPPAFFNTAMMKFFNARDDGNGLAEVLHRGGYLVDDNLRRVKNVRVECRHRKANGVLQHDKFMVDSIQMHRDASHMIQTGQNTSAARSISIANYFREQHGVNLKYPKLPLLKMKGNPNRETLIPMELCRIQENERYMYKLNDRQTSQMINFAVTLPSARWASIESGVSMLGWNRDDNLREYGLQISQQPTTVKGRLLPNPKVAFAGAGAGASLDPRTTGRWDLRGKKFMEVPTTIVSWGLVYIAGRGGCSNDQVMNFVKVLVTTYTGHGGKIQNKDPYVTSMPTPQTIRGNNLATFYNTTGNHFKAKPDLLIFVVCDKNKDNYDLIKKYCDVVGVASQVLQSSHVQKAQPQYCSNVSMKINAKLGGSTSQAHGQMKAASWFKIPTMIIGADVTHGAPGAIDQQSIAAFTMSWDTRCVKYAAACETNGQRTEFITDANINGKLKNLAQGWNHFLKAWPQHVIYMRDGVADGQYAGVLEQEVKSMRKMMDELDPKGASTRKWTVVIGSKRHHIRFFPDQQSGDKNGNPQPGTLVDTGCTHPWEYDFYLCAHSAIKGTARPVHYHVLLDEKHMSTVELQNMIYEASYQYVRSTTPISQHPAMYYAHLAAARATAHVNPEGGNLLPLGTPAKGRMWYC